MNIFSRFQEALLAQVRKALALFRMHATMSIVIFLLAAVLLIVWARLGFSLDVNRFFALEPGDPIVNECVRAGDMFCDGSDVKMWETDDIDGGCVSGVVETCVAPQECVDSGSSAACVTQPVCGDGKCNGSDTCSNCDADCGVCPTPEATATPDDMVGGGPPPGLPHVVSTLDPSISCGYAADIPHDFGWSVQKPTRGGVEYTVRSGVYHSNTAGCAPTTEAGGSGATFFGPWDCSNGDAHCFIYRWDPAAAEHCGRYQLDSGAYQSSDGTWISGAGIGVVLNFGVDCAHLVCQSNACVSVAGSGTNDPSCSTVGAVCGVAQTHLACNELFACVSTPGAGANTCATDTDCASPTHLACNEQNACVSVAGAGANTCATNADCASPTHLACSAENTCVAITGAGANTCATDTDCASPTHLACNEQNACVAVSGAGANTCATNADCASPTHLACNEQNACVAVSGGGANTCTTNTDCVVSSPSTSPSTLSNLICEPDSQKADTGETVQVRSSGGTSPYTWTAPSSSKLETDNNRVSVRYTAEGSYSVTVRDAAGRSDVCTVVVNQRPHRRRTPTPDPVLEIEKLVRNVTQGISERDAVTAAPTNTVEFMLEVSSTGSTTVTNVIVRDTLPDRLTYVSGSTTIDDRAAPDGIIAAGISLGDMPAGTSKIVRFRATVAAASFFTYATSVLTNIGFADGSNVTEVSDMAHVSVVKGVPITQVQTGPGETTLFALIIASIVTLLYVGYTGTDTFRRRELQGNIDVARRDKNQFNFKK